MTRHLLALLLLALAAATSATAQAPGTLEAIEQTFTRWMQANGVTRATLTVAQGDRLVLARGYGGLKPESRTLIGSLSKSITAVCVATLIQDGTLRFDTSLGEILDIEPRRYFQPRDRRLRAATVAELLTHRAGFSRGVDPVTGDNLSQVLRRQALTHTTMHDLVPGVLQTMLEREPGEAYGYTNAPYLLLGIAIEAVTRQPYEDYCRDAVLKPQGIRDAALHPIWRVLGSYGGWNLSAAEYLTFMRAFRTGPLLNADMRRWMLDPAGKEVAPGSPVSYSLVLVRRLPAGGHNLFHDGLWEYRVSPGTPSGAVSESIGTLAVSAAFGASWYVAYQPLVPEAARQALDREIYRAAFAALATSQR